MKMKGWMMGNPSIDSGLYRQRGIHHRHLYYFHTVSGCTDQKSVQSEIVRLNWHTVKNPNENQSPSSRPFSNGKRGRVGIIGQDSGLIAFNLNQQVRKFKKSIAIYTKSKFQVCGSARILFLCKKRKATLGEGMAFQNKITRT